MTPREATAELQAKLLTKKLKDEKSELLGKHVELFDWKTFEREERQRFSDREQYRGEFGHYPLAKQ